MADERETVSDEEFFAETMAGKPEPEGKAEARPEEKQEQQPEDGQARDEHGRFKAKEEQPETTAEQPVKETVEKPVEQRPPLAELLNERDKRQAAERERDEFRRAHEELQRRLRQPQQRQPEKLPDLLENPEAYGQTLEQRITAQIEQRFIRASVARAGRTHGEAFTEAWQEFDRSGDPGLLQRVRDSDDPGETIMEWHRQQKALREFGDDPAKYRDRLRGELRSELLKDAEFRKEFMASLQIEAGDNSRPSVVTPLKSLNTATAARRTDVGGEDLSDDEFLRSNTRLRR